jgi:hypothetical protein
MKDRQPKSEFPLTPYMEAVTMATIIHETDPKCRVSWVGEYDVAQASEGTLVVRFSTDKIGAHGIFFSLRMGDATAPIRDIRIDSEGQFRNENFTHVFLNTMLLDQELGYEEEVDLVGEKRVYKSERRKEIEEKLNAEDDAEYEAKKALGLDVVSNRDILGQLEIVRELLGDHWPFHLDIVGGREVKGPPTDNTTALFKRAVELLAKNKSMESAWNMDDADYELMTSRDGKNPDNIYFKRISRTTTPDGIVLQHSEVWEFFSDDSPAQYYEQDDVPIESQRLLKDDPEKLDLAAEIGRESRRQFWIKKEKGELDADREQIARGLALMKSQIGHQ